jgi:hypothetical protein
MTLKNIICSLFVMISHELYLNKSAIALNLELFAGIKLRGKLKSVTKRRLKSLFYPILEAPKIIANHYSNRKGTQCVPFLYQLICVLSLRIKL